MSIKLISLNVRGLGDRIKRRAILNFYRKHAGIICLQETHSTPDIEQLWINEWGGDIVFSHGTSKSRGVCILMPKGMLQVTSNKQCDLDGRIIAIEIGQGEENILLCNIYAPNEDCPCFFDDLFKQIQNNSHNEVIVGDFNLVLDPKKDRIGFTHNKAKSVEVIRTACNELFLSDIWRTRNERETLYSWYRTKPKLSASRIDFALISAGLCDLCQNVGYTTGLKSDHLAYFLFLNLNKNKRGKGYWKLNVSLLSNINYVNLMNETIDEVLETCAHMNIATKWEYLKYQIREVSKQFASEQASEIELIISQLSENIMEMEENLENANLEILARSKTDVTGGTAPETCKLPFWAMLWV